MLLWTCHLLLERLAHSLNNYFQHIDCILGIMPNAWSHHDKHSPCLQSSRETHLSLIIHKHVPSRNCMFRRKRTQSLERVFSQRIQRRPESRDFCEQVTGIWRWEVWLKLAGWRAFQAESQHGQKPWVLIRNFRESHCGWNPKNSKIICERRQKR